MADDFDQTVDALEWDTIAILDIDNREAWQKDMDVDKDAAYHWEKWDAYVKRYKIFFTEPIRA